MVFIEGGTFMMGDVIDNDDPDATPTHRVKLPDFKIGKYEVTYKQYDAFAGRTERPLPPSDSLKRGNRAVTYVNWKDAEAFCNYHGWRLPTEQEWEYAARAGGKKIKYAGTNNVDSLSKYARYDNNSAPYSYRVGSKKPNSAGLYDMSGNVFEWIGGYYQFYPDEGEKPKWDSLGVQSIKVMRGGSFREPKYISATYKRVGTLPEAEEYDIGFRCVDPLEN
ncbi:formylglycine-generating enzyme family protein [Fodinibius halophilus]|uniref:Formylglycine-generating enzyme family protein n=1 Tax=Fodinibius halophilus TaxID=1736908 RepID=A0A6M1T9I6_9BACT|nr:SUMF1/EgtB/PvdO family nonheme iron enzyme [Fodinibius halophilus]NGP88691.1 formylglycine-generating enzyme family protein [Fodinibius halophilus]